MMLTGPHNSPKTLFFDAKELREIRPARDRRIVCIKVEYEVVCVLSNGDITDDYECMTLNRPKPAHFLHFAPPFISL